MDLHHLRLRDLRSQAVKGTTNERQFEPLSDENPFNIVEFLKACAVRKHLDKGSRLHAYIRDHIGLRNNPYIGSTLVNMYAKCGALMEAQQVLEQLPVRDVVTWNALIAGYAQEGQGEEALKCFDDMLCEGHFPTAVTFACVLKACMSIGAATKGKEIHDKIVNLGMLENDIVLGTTLVNMYVKFGELTKAKQVLKELPIRNAVSWNTLVAGYAQQGQGEEALKCFNDMLHDGHLPDTVTFICVLKACGNIGAAAKGEEIHDKIANLGMLQKNIVLGTTLVDMYAKCGALFKAQQVLEELPIRDAVSWSALIDGYVKQGQGEDALKCFDGMVHEGHSPDVVTFVCVLKACGSIAATAKGEEIHSKIVSLGILDKNMVLGSTLVDMYAKCNVLAKAQQVLQELPIRDVVSWSALIAGYTEQGHGEEALKCFNDMLCEGHSPTAVTFSCILKACGSIGAAFKGKEIHDKIVSLGMLEKDVVLGNTLVDMYMKCGALLKAEQVLQELPIHDVVSWSALIAGYAKQGQGEEALECYNDMLHEGHLPTVLTFVSVIRACGSIRAMAKGNEIHDKIISLDMLEKSVVLGNTLVDMYVKCGAVTKAQGVLEGLPVRDVISWSALMSGYTEQGQGQETLKCFYRMLNEGHTPDAVTFICVLKGCGSIGAAAQGQGIHDKIVNLDILEKDIVLGNALVDMYVKCGALNNAQHVLEELPVRDVVSWNALIVGYAEEGQGEEALKCFTVMLCEGHSPTVIIFACVLNICGSFGAVAKGEEIHDRIASLGMLEKDNFLLNSLADMYMKCGAFAKVQGVLKDLLVHDVAFWSALMAGYVNQGQGEEALKCFDDIICGGHSPTASTFACALKACGSIGAAAKGEEIYGMIVSLGILENDIILGTTLVDMYVKCGALAKAHRVLEELPVRDVVSWNALIAGYAQHGRGQEVLKCFDDVLHEGHFPDAVTFICVLKACGSIGAAAKGEEIHDKIVRLRMLENDIRLGNSLVDMYVKCGALAKAERVLEELPVYDVVSWSAIIAGYAQQGQSVEALNYFERMQLNGVKPNSFTLTSVLSACSHSGLLDQAEIYFSEMSTMYSIYPDLQHYCCMIDLFSRAGKFNKALSVISEMPSDKCLPSWLALLGACRKWGEVKIGGLAFERTAYLDKSDAAAYVLMADIYTAAGMQEKADKIELMRLANKAQEKQGCLWWTDAIEKACFCNQR